MRIKLHKGDARSWSERHFGGIKLGDVRRERRAIKIAEGMAEKPGSSIPEMFKGKYDVKAAYSFFDIAEVKPEELQRKHRELVKEELKREGEYLLIEDGSEFNWSDKVERAGLGKTREKKQGFILQSSLAVRWEGVEGGESKRKACEVIGIVHQEYYPRVARPDGEGNSDSKKRKERERESQLWERSTEEIGDAPSSKETRWVRVADRGADISFFLAGCKARGHGFVVRAAQNRVLLDERGKRDKRKLFERSREQVALGHFELNLRQRDKQPARTAQLSLSATRLRLRHPDTGQALECAVLRVWEAQPPSGCEALEWILLTDASISTFEQALNVAFQYAARWLIEEYHKCLKTGLRADELQLHTAERLFAAIAIMAVVALRLLALKEAARSDPLAEASHSGLSSLELQVLAHVSNRQLLSVADVVLALGRLGGHMNRKSDGLPGWQTLWKGRKQLDLLVQGFLLARSLPDFAL